MRQAQRFLHAETGGSYKLPTTRAMLPIRQNLNRLTSLNRTQRAVLIEVVTMAENGKHKAFTTGNNHLVECIGGTVRTISRTLAVLERFGLIASTGATKLRRITPAERLRACYTGTEPEQFAAVEELNAALDKEESNLSIDTKSRMSIDKTEMSIDKTSDVYRHSESVSIDIQGSVYRQTGSPYKETNNEQYKEQQKEEEARALRSALATAEKKIEALENENANLVSDLKTVTHQRDQLRHTLLGQRPDASASHTEGGPALRDFAASQYSTEAGFRALAAKINCATACAAYYLPDMRTKAEGLTPRDETGWKNYVHSWLRKERDSEAGLVTNLATPKLAKAGQVEKRMSAIEQAMALDDNANF
ncbi:hypothetical protein [Hymenobacter sp. YC55]|uniref:hypothetical protein n=1 Tax=Hymenobacter sp. YC55 TaxID=3034019 RepID=UPI0023F9AED6|nr:hypothetical protein [Hymenobacter sp. YC55]MDF7810777.1 hypothetical protein [Hymenobacter sp. YC55]